MPALRAFAAETECALVVTQPDRPAGRGQKLVPTPVKRAAGALAIPTFEPAHLRAAVAELAAVNADVFGVASYGKIVPQAILDLAPRGALNVHPSLLPLYRGATPLQSQLRDGATLGGVTIILMDAGMDTGDIVLRDSCAIGPEETYGELHDRLARRGAELLARACEDLREGRLQRTPQQGLAEPADIARTTTRPLTKADLLVDFSRPAREVVDHVRSLSPAPAARGVLPGETHPVKLLRAHAADAHARGELSVRAGDGRYVVIERLVPPNRAAMSGSAYLAASQA